MFALVDRPRGKKFLPRLPVTKTDETPRVFPRVCTRYFVETNTSESNRVLYESRHRVTSLAPHEFADQSPIITCAWFVYILLIIFFFLATSFESMQRCFFFFCPFVSYLLPGSCTKDEVCEVAVRRKLSKHVFDGDRYVYGPLKPPGGTPRRWEKPVVAVVAATASLLGPLL